MFKFIFRFIADVIIAFIVALAILFGTKSNISFITSDTPKYDFNIVTPNVTETEVIAADMTDDVDEAVSEEVTKETE